MSLVLGQLTMGVYENDNYMSLPKRAEAIRTTVVPITPFIRTTVVPISGVIGPTVVRIANVTGQRPVIVTLRAIGPKCGQIYRATLPTIGHKCIPINCLLSHDSITFLEYFAIVCDLISCCFVIQWPNCGCSDF